MKARNKHVAVGVAVVVASAVALGAYASMEERGAELFREGVRLADEGEYLGALRHFERAMAYRPRLNVLWNIACCHVVRGNRDLAVACLDRYMEHDTAFQQSAEMQAVVAAIAAEPQDMPNLDRRGQLWDQVEAASRAVEEGRATPATAAQRRYGVGNRGARIKTGESSLEWEHARVFTTQCGDAANAGDFEAALEYAERAAAYSTHPNVYWNISVFHLKLGHRDEFLQFMDLYQQRVPQLRENAEFQQVMADIADAPPTIRGELRDSLDERLDIAVNRALPPTPTPAVRPSVRTEMGDQD